MGRDFTLSDNHPSVIINGSKYHYGIDHYQQYMVESAHYEKDYWTFKEKQDLEAFLINLPESADRNLRLKLHPDWREVTPEQRDAYFEEDKLRFRAMAAEKVAAGTAQSFNMDFEGKHGPYSPQRIESRSSEPPLERAERQLSEYKATHAPPARDPGLPEGRIGDMIHGLNDQSWQSGLSEAGKLRVLEGELEWVGVDDRQKEAVLAREVDFTRITRDQLNFLYEDVGHFKFENVDESAGRRLFDKANFEKTMAEIDKAGNFSEQLAKVRPTTRDVVQSMLFDEWPRAGAIVDFGLDSQQHYEALYYPVRNQEIKPAALDAALGYGEKLTELTRAAPSNPHKEVEFYTSWDVLVGRNKAEQASKNGPGGPGTQKQYDASDYARSPGPKGKGKDEPVL
jgi:hypothetical protein